MRFENRIALVTGAGSGIGRAIATALAREGAHVVVNDADREAAQATAGEIEAVARRALSAPADVSSEEAVNRMVEKSIEVFGRIDLLVVATQRSQWPPRPRIVPARSASHRLAHRADAWGT